MAVRTLKSAVLLYIENNSIYFINSSIGNHVIMLDLYGGTAVALWLRYTLHVILHAELAVP